MGLSWASLIVMCVSTGMSHGRSPRLGDYAPKVDDKVIMTNTKQGEQLDLIKNIMKNVAATEEVTICHAIGSGNSIK